MLPREFFSVSILIAGPLMVSECVFFDGFFFPPMVDRFVPDIFKGDAKQLAHIEKGLPQKKSRIIHQDCIDNYGNKEQDKKHGSRGIISSAMKAMNMDKLAQMLPWDIKIICLVEKFENFEVFNRFLDAVDVIVSPCKNKEPSESQCRPNATFDSILRAEDYVPPKEWPCLQKSLDAREFYVEMNKVYEILNPCVPKAPKLELKSTDPSELKNDENVGYWVHALWWFWWYFLSGQVVFQLAQRNGDLEATTYKDGLIFGHAFNPRKPTKILIHGYVNFKGSSMNNLLKKVYLKKIGRKASDESDETDYSDDSNDDDDDDDDHPNVIIVDWSSLSFEPYPVTRYRIIAVSKEIVSLVKRLVKEYGIPCDTVHLLGHSLGAHIAGIAGNLLAAAGNFCRKPGRDGARRSSRGKKNQFGRITGLDPANPLFLTTPEKWRLGHYSAKFVDVIHTSDYTLGNAVRAGHADFYVNSGLPIQPGCGFGGIVGVNLEGLANLDLACSHYRAVYYYAESIHRPKAFKARQCSTAINFKLRYCDHHRTSYMGEWTPKNETGIFYLNTASEYPYGLGAKGI